MNIKSFICLTLLAVGFSAPMWAKDAPAAGKITVDYEAGGYVYKYNGAKYSSARKLAKHLDKKGAYRLFFESLSSDAMMLEQVKAMEAAGISINSVERRNNRDASTEVTSVRKLKERTK